ncbi:putative reverse transcriptase domain-containing protein [Tanacetum coccineum]
MKQQVEFRIDLVSRSTPVVKSPYRLALSEMQELSEQLQELQDKVSVGITEEGEADWHVTYLRFIANFSKIVKPITSLTERNQKYEWGAEQEEVFQTLKNDLYVKDKILATSSETPKVKNAPAEMLRDMDQQMEKRADDDGKSGRAIQTLEGMLRACVIDYGGRWGVHLPLAELSYNNSYHSSIHVDQGKVQSGERSSKELCWKKRKLAPRYVEPFEILERIGSIAYSLRLPEELSSVHDTFYVSNLEKKCFVDANLHVPLDEIEADKTLRFAEEPKGIMDREI